MDSGENKGSSFVSTIERMPAAISQRFSHLFRIKYMFKNL